MSSEILSCVQGTILFPGAKARVNPRTHRQGQGRQFFHGFLYVTVFRKDFTLSTNAVVCSTR